MQMVCQCNPNRFTVKPKLLVDALLGKLSESFMMIGVRVPEEDKNYIWDNWSKLFKLPEGTRDLVKTWVLKIANKSFKDWKSDLNLDYVQQDRSPFEK